MSCSKCGTKVCCCKETVITERGKAGKRGQNAKNLLVVKDAQSPQGVVYNVKEIRFTDFLATVTMVSPGVAEVNMIPPATVWNDLVMPWYVAGSETIKPQYTVEGNKISFRGQLIIPLSNAGNLVNVNGGNAYLAVASVTPHAASVTVIANANTNNGTPQGRFLTADVVTTPNLPISATPVARDIVFFDVPGFRRYTVGTRVIMYRTFCDIRIGATNTVFKDGSNNLGAGCVMVLSPFNKEYDGSGTLPLGNDPQALGISKVTSGVAPADYIGATDDNPFTIGAGGSTNPFSCNAHKIDELGGFIFNLDGLQGFLN